MTCASRYVLLLGVLAGCQGASPDPYSAEASRDQAEDHPLAGLFTPGNRIGYEAPREVDAGAGLAEAEVRKLEEAIREAGMMDRCALPDAPEGTPGSLTFSFQTTTYRGSYEPENCGAVWIEDADGNYIATPLIWAELRLRNLLVWNGRRCRSDDADVVSSATLPDHSTTHEGSWDGKDHMGRVAPDGIYVLNVEVTEDEFNYGRRAQVMFEKGPVEVMVGPEDADPVRGLTMLYMPGSASGGDAP